VHCGRYLDTSGDGLIGPDELESAIRAYRRVQWEEQAIQARNAQSNVMPCHVMSRAVEGAGDPGA
jgi:hypothetical protein